MSYLFMMLFFGCAPQTASTPVSVPYSCPEPVIIHDSQPAPISKKKLNKENLKDINKAQKQLQGILDK